MRFAKKTIPITFMLSIPDGMTAAELWELLQAAHTGNVELRKEDGVAQFIHIAALGYPTPEVLEIIQR